MNKHAKSVLKELSKFEGFNNMDPEDIVAALKHDTSCWKDIFWSPQQDDTIYLVARKGKEKDLKLLVYEHIEASEVDYLTTSLYIELGIHTESFGKGQSVLRLWWD